MYYWLFLIPAFFFVLAIIGAVMQDRAEKRKQALKEYFKTDNKVGRALDSNSRKHVKETLKEFEAAYQNSQDYLGYAGKSLHMTDKEDLQAHLKELEEEAWLKKAGKHSDAFAYNYEIVTCADLDNFKDVELIMKAKKKCLDEWQKYFAVDLSEYETTIYPKRYLRENMGEMYDPCMESRETLEKKLSECIQAARPEYRRKMRLYEDIVEYVSRHPDIPRSDLFRVKFSGATAEEVKHCYKELIKKNRLFEMKMGNRFFVSLSDKEKSKHPHSAVDEEKVVSQTESVEDKPSETLKEKSRSDSPEVVKILKDKGVEYIDLTKKGGSVYFFDEGLADELKHKGLSIHYAKNGTKKTGGRPAWYVKVV